MTILYFIIGLGLLIFIHEFGHFIVAKMNGIRVERFSLGFGPRLIKFQIGETEYCISALPLGGYVKMTGQEDFEEEKIQPLDDPRAFSSKGLLARLSVVLAGPGMNLLLPFLLMPIVFMLGRSEPKFLDQAPEVMGVVASSAAAQGGFQKGDRIRRVNDKEVSRWNDVLIETSKPPGTKVKLTWESNGKIFEQTLELKPGEKGMAGILGIEPMFFLDVDPVVGEILAGDPAEVAGIKIGDRVVAIDGKSIAHWQQMSDEVNASAGKELVFTVERGMQKLYFKITPNYNEKFQKYVIGVTKASDPNLYETRRYGISDAFKKGVSENLMLFGMTFKVLKDLVTLKASVKELGGPIRIAQISAKAAERGLGNFLYLLAFLSIQLGILNLLPIPVLDGGHVLFMGYEGIARKPLSAKKRLVAQQVGMFLLLTLMVLVTVNDIDAVWGLKDLLEKIKGIFG